MSGTLVLLVALSAGPMKLAVPKDPFVAVDGGRAYLTQDTLTYAGVVYQPPRTANQLFVFSEERAIVTTAGGLFEVNFLDGGSRTILSSQDAGSWTPESAGTTANLLSIDYSQGHLWVGGADSFVGHRALPLAWTSLTVTSASNYIVLAIDGGAFIAEGQTVLRVSNSLGVGPTGHPSVSVSRLRRHGDEVWAIGDSAAAVLRYQP